MSAAPEPCHHGVLGCACGLTPSPLCAECQGDVELGVWMKREHEYRISHYKKEADRLGTMVARALAETTWERSGSKVSPGPKRFASTRKA